MLKALIPELPARTRWAFPRVPSQPSCKVLHSHIRIIEISVGILFCIIMITFSFNPSALHMTPRESKAVLSQRFADLIKLIDQPRNPQRGLEKWHF